MCNDTDVNGQCETALWVRELANGDFAIALVNGANSTANLTATASDIFTYQDLTGTSRPSTQLASSWDVYDLWGSRLSNAEAQGIIMANSTTGALVQSNSTTRYNATAMSYADGIAAGAPALFGTKVATMQPGGQVQAQVGRHGVGLFRLRQVQAVTRRDEL